MMGLLARMALPRPLLVILLPLTLAALLPWQPQGPFDARDWSLIDGVTMTMPWWQPLIEPFSAPYHILIGAPDFRLASISLAVWVGLLTFVVVVSRRTASWWRRLLRALPTALFALWCVPALMLLYSHLHFPGWRLQFDDLQWLIADLQSHTLGSHDGLVRAAYNLQWHRERGYNVVAVTEHNDPQGSHYVVALNGDKSDLAVVPGIEVANEYNSFLLGLGLKPGLPLDGKNKTQAGYSQRFINGVDAVHQGAVVSMAWRLGPGDVEKLADAGVHAFELMNAGHPNIPDAVRDEMLRMEREGRVRLVSSTDWHGWGGASRTWTMLRVPGNREMTPQQRAAEVVRLLREGNSNDVVPVVAGYQGDIGIARLIFSPLVESVRYAAELSPPRLAGWWLWVILLSLLAKRLRGSGCAPLPTFTATTLLLVGGVLLWRGIALYTTGVERDVVQSTVLHELGSMAVYAALPLLMVGIWQMYSALKGRADRKHPL